MHFPFLPLLAVISCLVCAESFSQENYSTELPENFAELSSDVQAVILEYVFFSEKANQVWGDDYEESSVRTFVKYLDDFHTRVYIDFDAGLIRVETQGSKTPVTSLRHAIAATLLTPADPSAVDLYTAADMGITGKPFLSGQVLDHDGKVIEYPWRANRFAEYLTDHKLKKSGARYWVNIPMVRSHRQKSAGRYRGLAQQAGDKYRVSVPLIMAIMETESSFNPFAVSHAGAYGLMQVMQSTAGKDVFQRIYRRHDKPGRNYLLNPANNIDTGTAYLSILRDVYLRDVQGWLKKEYCMIAAYNGGTGNLLKTFSSDRRQAIARINRMSADEVYQAIVRRHPKAESRNYLKKVTQFKRRYVSW